MYVIKCLSKDKEKFLTREGHLTTLDDSEKYPTRDVALTVTQINGLADLGLAKVRRFIPASPKVKA